MLLWFKLNTGEMEMVTWLASVVVRFKFYNEVMVVCMSV